MKIFISFNRYNESTCKILREILENAFGKSVEFYLSATDIRAGNDWTEDLKKNINNSDALISIFCQTGLVLYRMDLLLAC